MAQNLNLRCVLLPAPVHTPKAVTYHEPTATWLFMIGHSLGRMGARGSQPKHGSRIQNKNEPTPFSLWFVFATLALCIYYYYYYYDDYYYHYYVDHGHGSWTRIRAVLLPRQNHAAGHGSGGAHQDGHVAHEVQVLFRRVGQHHIESKPGEQHQEHVPRVVEYGGQSISNGLIFLFFISVPRPFQNGATQSGFEMCFAVGYRRQIVWRQLVLQVPTNGAASPNQNTPSRIQDL